jgi:hypothetical protein
MEYIRENVEEIREDIKELSGDRALLVAVTKSVGIPEVEKLLECGIKDMGENRVQVLQEKREKLGDRKDEMRWHFIGNLQKNKVKYIAEYIHLIHSVNKLSLATEIDRQAAKNNRVIDVLLEVNVSGEESKEGYSVEELYRDIPELLKLKNIKIKGLMTMAPFTEDEELIHTVFSSLRELKDRLNLEYFNGELTELSMGMSGDYKIALEEGATIIRVGGKLYEKKSEI